MTVLFFNQKFLRVLIVAFAINFLFFACGTTKLPDSEDEDSQASTSENSIGNGASVNSISDISACDNNTAGNIYFVKDAKAFYTCDGVTLSRLDTSSSSEDSTSTVGAAGAKGDTGEGYELQNLSSFTLAHITSSASGNTGTNQFTSGTGASAFTNALNLVDASDAALSDFTASVNYASATTGLATGFGCVRINLDPVLNGASVARGYAYAKIGLLTSSGSANLIGRWESSVNGLASNFTLHSNLTFPATTAERNFYISTEFFGNYLNFCIQGGTARNHILRFYQLYVAM